MERKKFLHSKNNTLERHWHSPLLPNLAMSRGHCQHPISSQRWQQQEDGRQIRAMEKEPECQGHRWGDASISPCACLATSLLVNEIITYTGSRLLIHSIYLSHLLAVYPWAHHLTSRTPFLHQYACHGVVVRIKWPWIWNTWNLVGSAPGMGADDSWVWLLLQGFWYHPARKSIPGQ